VNDLEPGICDPIGCVCNSATLLLRMSAASCDVTLMWWLRDHIDVQVVEFVECYEKHADALVRFAATVVGPDDAEDVVSEAVLGILRTSPPGVRDMRAYLYRAVLNAGRKHLRSLGRRGRREQKAAVANVVADELVDPKIAAALIELSPQQRAVVHLAYWEDLSAAMIAERLGVSSGTVRRQLARGRKRLREALDEYR